MARARLVKPTLFTNEGLGDLPIAARLLFVGLWCLADRQGRLEDRPRRIAVELFPYDHDIDVDDLLTRLMAGGFIYRYEVEGQPLIWVPGFPRHQKPHVREAESVLPPYLGSPKADLGSPKADLGSPKARQGGRIGSDPDRVDPVPKSEAEAEADHTRARVSVPALNLDLDHSDLEPGSPFSRPFTLAYVKHYELRESRPPSPLEQSAAQLLERDFGCEECTAVAKSFDWQKHPNYMRPILEERKNGNRGRKGGRKPESAEGPGGLDDRVPGVDERLAAQFEQRRHRTA